MIGRLLIMVLLCCAVVSTGFISCSSKNIKKNPNLVEEALEGWINEETYQLAAGGTPVQSLKAIDQRKESARLDAILNARCQIIDKFTGVKIKREELNNNDLDGISIPEDIKEIVKSGIVKKTVWDYDENCEIIFEIKYPGLKKKIEGKSEK
jgi:hypothetical protein